MMKYIISESKLHSLIYDYLTSSFQPDYEWGPKLHDFYKNDVAKYGYHDFLINGKSAFDYRGATETLGIREWVSENLNDLFGNLWGLTFVEWFEDNSGLPVKNLNRYRTKKREFNESELMERCWPGYTQKGMKTMFGKRYPNCVKKNKK